MASDSGYRNWDDARDVLRTWREDNIRQSEEVIELWETVLQQDIHKLGDEMWQVYEQVCIAAFDCHRLDISDECITALKGKFSDSVRVQNLIAMRYEVTERFDDALKIYEAILLKDKTNLAAQKRKVSIYKGKGCFPEAIKELTEYLKKFMSDQEGWLELCELYIQEQDYQKAAFCMEELIMFNPHNHLYHQRYAEIRYTQGNLENIEIARAYFSQAAKLNPNNMRALYGLFLAANSIASNPKCPAAKKTENSKYATWAAKLITKKYQNPQCEKKEEKNVKVIQNMLDTLQLTSSH